MSPYHDPHVSAGEIADYLHSHSTPMPDLLPCPFCGHVPELLPCLNHGHFVECENPACPILLEIRPYDTPEQAAAAWNRRPAPVTA